VPSLLGLCALACLQTTLACLQTIAWSQPPQAEASELASDRTSPEYLQKQMLDLSHPNYRARQLARWRLEQTPLATLQQIEQSVLQLDQNGAAQLIDIASSLAIHSDTRISVEAHAILERLSKDASSIGHLANNTLRAIADLQESKATEALIYAGAYIGAVDFSYNGRLGGAEDYRALRIDASFRETDEMIERIRFLKSVEAVSLSGPAIDSRYFRALSELTQLKVIKLRGCTLTAEDLQLFVNFQSLEHLGLNYMPVDDALVPQLLELPINQSMRLYGTKISEVGERLLREQFDGIEIYRGNGGFLGVSTDTANAVVTRVTTNSAAEVAGIQIDDRLTHIDGVPINSFADLRRELGKHPAGKRIEVQLKRGDMELNVSVDLLEEPN
jgi:hypothetical protein